MKRFSYAFLSLCILASCAAKKEQVDLIVQKANIYTVDSSFSLAHAMAIKDGKIVAITTDTTLDQVYDAKEVVDADGKFIYPGFIDAHAHFVGYAVSLLNVDLVGTKSWDDVIERTKAHAAKSDAPWVVGRGWDQNDWDVKVFPSKERLDSLFPDRPVLLTRIDGHAAIANQAALDKAGIKPGQTIAGGVFETQKGKLTGLLVDNAVGPVEKVIPNYPEVMYKQALKTAAINCFAQGLTTVSDCGIMRPEAELLLGLEEAGQLDMRLYVMLSDSKENYDWALAKGVVKTSHINIGGYKFYADGALGSRGACLRHDYTDRPGWRGFLLSDSIHFAERAAALIKSNFQMCTHAIGDSANRDILRTYAAVLKGKNDRRWRIEHAQVVDSNDFHYFGDNNIVPSVQPTHATSDMYWAKDRLGAQRIKTAYAYKQLLQQNGWIALGTDFPVEDISALKTFYAAVVRKDASGYPATGFEPSNALSREETLRGMTIWAAKAQFEEKEKGSLEYGKWADFTMLDTDLMKVADSAILKSKVLATFVGGKQVYKQ
ncbi:hypothetical protein LX64_00095 [Chitinophaga skermanii]|uniref:Amidohydrolase 3 domain-containing protein n=1 Tax=Chitinophaga skermanii TaxID=331697 RepID=A0A327R436_9BACT|nr:amidohydrolase [Chitinophaga skermanii]RAJ10493.1 hypothetical protein LX64_00095 [Chitinophaga skermanii]